MTHSPLRRLIAWLPVSTLAAALLVLLTAGATRTVVATEAPDTFDPCNVTGVERIVAVGDVHGAYDAFVGILKAAGIADAQLHWAGGRTHFVQTGDTVDRGPASRKVLDLLKRLEQEAPKSGGRVYPLLGNHEVMTMLGDLRYTSPAEYEEFRTSESEELRARYLERAAEEARKAAEAEKKHFDADAFRAELLKTTPLGYVERVVAFGPTGEYGRWLRQHDTVVRINRVMFVHASISLGVAPRGCQDINATVRADLTTNLTHTLAAPRETLAASPDGPLWFRFPRLSDDAAYEAIVDSVLATVKARALVGGHSVVPGGHIAARFHDKVFMIDTGMLSSVYPGGRASALEITPDAANAIYVDGRESLATGFRNSAAPPSPASRPSS
jgi:hypothetical protein